MRPLLALLRLLGIMKIKLGSQSGAVSPRAFGAFLLCAAGALMAVYSFAGTPDNGTITPDNPKVTYTAGPFFVINPTPILEVDVGPECNNPAQPCDDFALTVDLPAGYSAAHQGAALKVSLSWSDTGSGNSDYDLYVYNNPRSDCTPNDCTATNGTQAADHQSASSSNPEVTTLPLVDGTAHYTVVVVPYTPTGETATVTVELLQGAGSGSATFGSADPSLPGQPRFQNFYAPPGSAKSRSGEFNIGFNPKSGRVMTMNDGPVWRLTPPELLSPTQPECCEALWEDKSNDTVAFGLDPILWTDQKTGRTFASNSTVGANAVYAYSDNDGDSWTPFGIAAPNGGADHETIGSGPYPDILSVLATPVNQGEGVYYCSQDIVGPAACYRSDDLGVSYGPSVLAYNGQGSGVSGGTCGGLHGHLHVAPDGAVWLPVPQCSGLQGGVFSTDAGTTWHTFTVPNAFSQQQGADPSIAIDSDSTIYYSYINNEPVAAGQQPQGHARVQVGHLDAVSNTVSWSNSFDLGATHGIVNAAEIEAVGGSSGRAAVGFLGADIAGDYQAQGYPGRWYAFIATTYDGGKSWVTVNATPNDPVQSQTGIWQGGGSNLDRNLLDFNEITVDDKGHVLYGYSDGCVSTECIAGTAPNDFTANMRVARQSGGKSIFASFDASVNEPAAPKPPCLSGTRDPSASHLTWKAPDNAGSDIQGYQILRGTTAGSETVIVNNTGNAKTTYNDTTANPAVAHYFYVVKAINGIGTGTQSNEIDLTVTIPPPVENLCTVPGLTKLTDPSGDTSAALGVVSTPAPPGSDLLSFQIAQPFQADGIPRLVFTINTNNGQSPQPTGSAWYVAMKLINGNTTTYKGVHMAWTPTSPATPTFESYTPGANNSGGVDGRFVTPGSTKPAEASSSYASPFNKVVIVVKASDLGFSPGTDIAGFVSGVSQSTDPGATVGAGATSLYDQMPDSLAFTGNYTVINNNTACASTATPTPTPSPSPSPSPSGSPTATPTPTPTPTPVALFQFNSSTYPVQEAVT